MPLNKETKPNLLPECIISQIKVYKVLKWLTIVRIRMQRVKL